jgi:hypothetical protein
MSNTTYWQTAGFYNEAVDVESVMKILELHIQQVPVLFKGFTDEQLLQKPAPGKWSKKEILGHLIDSAINNLRRVTEVQFLPQPYRVVSYKQNELVAVNHYQELPIDHLLELWSLLNKQIVYVVRNIPPKNLEFPVDPGYDNGELRTLGWVFCDYVAHMEHHLKQVTAKQDINSQS